ncbi:helix-turn-helix domain-containing protein [Solibacillus cecembensis]|uniref:helix-turn-helix domain-containing protein n=1 Tax=Solibacillus cecembensis TaxID=459347 RepID=UPI003D05EE6E
MNGLLKMVGANIKSIRSEKGLTREQLAEICEMQPTYLADVERGRRNITLQSLEKIAAGLGESPSKIIRLENLKIEDDYMEKHELLLLINEKLNGRSQEELKLIIKLIDEIFGFIDK